jgi:phosphatidylglycerophosphate synthase
VLQLVTVTLALVLTNFGAGSGQMAVLHWTTAAFTLASGIQYVARGTQIVGHDRA